MISRAILSMLFVCWPLLSFAETEDVWLGLWNEGERGAHIYNKIRITPNILLFSSGGNWDYLYFPSEKKARSGVG